MKYPPIDDPDVLRAHRDAAVIDLHVDSVIQNRLFGYTIEKRHRALLRGQPLFWHADLPRMRDAAYGGACLGVHYFPTESEAGWRAALRQIDEIHRLATLPGVRLATTSEDWLQAEQQGELALAPGVEGAHILNGKIERLDELAARSTAYLTLTHFSRNTAATPSMGRGANEQDGLTHFGREVVQRCNELGIAIDVAHVNMPGVLDACAHSSAPVLCTHTGAKGIHNSPRNISDAAIDKIASTGGAIGVIHGPIFLAGRLWASTERVADHIDYIVQRVGIEHLAVGTDYDGWLTTIPNDQRDCRDLVRLTSILLERGYTEAMIRRMYRENTVRVFKAVEDHAAQRKTTPGAANAGA